MTRKNTALDFWNSVDKSGGPDACWPWKKSRDPVGYGNAYFSGWWIAHRLAFFLTNGFKPEAVCHKCDNPPCCNPTHLFAGTKTINSADRDRKGRQRAPRGERAATAKLSDGQVLELRQLYAEGNTSQAELAKRFSLDQTTVSDITRGKTWRHLPVMPKTKPRYDASPSQN